LNLLIQFRNGQPFFFQRILEGDSP
jgi:hypothetical protein